MDPNEVARGTGRPGVYFWVNVLRIELGNPVNQFAELAERIGPAVNNRAPIDWASVESAFGCPLPSDYKSFCDIYGSGYFCDMTISTPGVGHEAEFFALLKRKYAQVEQLPRTEYDPPIYPEEAGIIAWGESVEGHTLAWLPTSLDPDCWPSIVAFAGYPELNSVIYAQDLSFSSFLLQHSDPDRLGILDRDPWQGDTTFVPLDD